MLKERFERARSEGRKLLVPYVCAGYPTPEDTLSVLLALAAAGADAIELGIPFSDPLADGPVIQKAAQTALMQGMDLNKALEVARAFAARETGVPLVLMSYLNPLLAMGASLPEALDTAGIQALVVPDLPPEARDVLPRGLPPQVTFVAPNTPEARMHALCQRPSPFLYAVALLGVTGARAAVQAPTEPLLARLRLRTTPPVLVGFGVATPTQAVRLSEKAEGVIVGSALVKALEGALDPGARAREFLEPFRQALDHSDLVGKIQP